jgi:hypothetical protein
MMRGDVSVSWIRPVEVGESRASSERWADETHGACDGSRGKLKAAAPG